MKWDIYKDINYSGCLYKGTIIPFIDSWIRKGNRNLRDTFNMLIFHNRSQWSFILMTMKPLQPNVLTTFQLWNGTFIEAMVTQVAYIRAP